MQQLYTQISLWTHDSGCPLCFKILQDESIVKHLQYFSCKVMKSHRSIIGSTDNLQKLLNLFKQRKKAENKALHYKKGKCFSSQQNTNINIIHTGTNKEYNTYGCDPSIQYSLIESDRISRSIIGNLGDGGKLNGQQVFTACINNKLSLISTKLLRLSPFGRKLLNRRYNTGNQTIYNKLNGVLNTVCY